MKIAIFCPKGTLTASQQKQLSDAGEVVFIDEPMLHPVEYFKDIASGATVLGLDPDNFGGFEKATEQITLLLNSLPQVKSVALDTTSFGWIDLGYCKKRGITVCNVPGYSRESVAEHVLGLLLCLAKRILITDRRTQKGQYKMEMGFELKGKTLGIIGLGNIGSRVAELGLAIGMKVIAYNRSPKTQQGVEMKTLDEVLALSDAISIHTTHEPANKNLIGKEQMNKMKQGVIMVNVTDREIISEELIAEALKSGKIYGYAYEGEDLEHTPLAEIENAIGIKGFGWYTKEAIQNLYQIWVDNIVALAKNTPQHIVNNA